MSTSFLSFAVGRTLRTIKDLPGAYQLYKWRTERLVANRKGSKENVFVGIHEENAWNNEESISGIGSMKVHTQELTDRLPAFCERFSIRTFLDAPCGDFNWMRHVAFNEELMYIGGDIVEKLVQENSKKYGDERRKFIHLDIIRDQLMKADLMFVRDCLVHLSYEDISLFLKNLLASDIRYLLTTSFPYTRNNYDITTGNWRAINLQRAPFNFPAPLATIHEKTIENKCQYYDKSMNLYAVSDLARLHFLTKY